MDRGEPEPPRLRERLARAFGHVGRRSAPGSRATTSAHRRVLEHARRLAAAGLAHDRAAFGVRRVRGHSRPRAAPSCSPPPCARRSGSRTPADPRRSRSISSAVGSSPPGNLSWSQLPPVIQAPGRARARVVGDRRAELLRRGGVLQVELPHLQAAVDEMRVAVVEAGQQQPPARFDHARLRPHQRPHVVVAFPRRTIRSPRTATARASGRASSTVHTCAPRMTRSAGARRGRRRRPATPRPARPRPDRVGSWTEVLRPRAPSGQHRGPGRPRAPRPGPK